MVWGSCHSCPLGVPAGAEVVPGLGVPGAAAAGGRALLPAGAPDGKKVPKTPPYPRGGVTWTPAMSPGCDTAPCPPQLGQIRPSPLRDLLARVRDRLRNIFHCGNIWIRDKLNLQPPTP